MGAPETETTQAVSPDRIGTFLARSRGHFLAGDACHEYETQFANTLRSGHAYDQEYASNTYKLAATAFMIAYIESTPKIQYDILHAEKRSTYAPVPSVYLRKRDGFFVAAPGVATLEYRLNTGKKGDRGTPEALTRALVTTLKRIQPYLFEHLEYTEPYLAERGFIDTPLRPLSIYELPISPRLSLQIHASATEFETIYDEVSLHSNAICQFGLVVRDPDGATASKIELPAKRKILHKKITPTNILRAIFAQDPDVVKQEHWIRYDLPEGITPTDLESIFDELYRPDTKNPRPAGTTRFTNLVYSIIPVQDHAQALTTQRLVIHVTESKDSLRKRQERKAHLRMKRRTNLREVFASDLAITPTHPH